MPSCAAALQPADVNVAADGSSCFRTEGCRQRLLLRLINRSRGASERRDNHCAELFGPLSKALSVSIQGTNTESTSESSAAQ
ncbi:Hypothetical predicted protein [Xyrichtys novacula]|uniref:Uncharacterized protein n=1 Tax=Xyrichtys novacula TaxID=13765 RepID=A0AAV1F027_XYRNO|nr:Hypothetical predicted protein [Xyrichtys novacula]